jgi:hypothetical protein
MTRSFIALAVALFLGNVCADTAALAQGMSPAGTYQIAGAAPNTNAPYAGLVAVAPNGPKWSVVWNYGTHQVQGIGLMNGNVLSVAYLYQGAAGLVVMVMGSDGNLTGNWLTTGYEGMGTERWTRAR